MCYTAYVNRGTGQSVPPQVMRLRRAVLQITPKSLVPPRLPLYKSRPFLTPSKSTLLQLLIPLHFISFISNTYKKPGGGCLLLTTKFGNSSPPLPNLSLPLLPNLSLPSLPNLSFRAKRGICCFLLPSPCLCLITSLRPCIVPMLTPRQA